MTSLVRIYHYSIGNKSRANKHILVVIDACTIFVRLYPTRTTNTKEVIRALKDYFRSYSRPKQIISDRGTCFTSTGFREFLDNNGIQHIKTATGSPQANGQVEWVNRSLGPMIAKLIYKDSEKHWNTECRCRINTTAINTTVQRSIKEYPSVIFGVKQRGKILNKFKESFCEHNDFVMI